jgi:Rer1 family
MAAPPIVSNDNIADGGDLGGSGGEFQQVGGKLVSVYKRVERFCNDTWLLHQRYLDKTTPHHLYRWLFTLLLVVAYTLIVYMVRGFHIVTYAASIYALNLFIRFISPAVDPDKDPFADVDNEHDQKSIAAEDGKGDGELPTVERATHANNDAEEFRPFIRSLPEFKFWLSVTRALLLSILCTFFPFLDIPVYWPILVLYFVVLFAVTMKKQITHMLTHRYVPFTIGKPKFDK